MNNAELLKWAQKNLAQSEGDIDRQIEFAKILAMCLNTDELERWLYR